MYIIYYACMFMYTYTCIVCCIYRRTYSTYTYIHTYIVHTYVVHDIHALPCVHTHHMLCRCITTNIIMYIFIRIVIHVHIHIDTYTLVVC